MRAAPPVQVVFTGSVGWRAVQLFLPALAAVVFLAWGMLRLGSVSARLVFWLVTALSVFVLVATVLVAVHAGWARWFGLQATPRRLVWDGQTWQLDGVQGELRVMLHLGSWLLLRHQSARIAAQWLALSRAELGAAYAVFCAAVYCRPPESTPAGSPRQAP